jgi:hypothetical protein
LPNILFTILSYLMNKTLLKQPNIFPTIGTWKPPSADTERPLPFARGASEPVSPNRNYETTGPVYQSTPAYSSRSTYTETTLYSVGSSTTYRTATPSTSYAYTTQSSYSPHTFASTTYTTSAPSTAYTSTSNGTTSPHEHPSTQSSAVTPLTDSTSSFVTAPPHPTPTDPSPPVTASNGCLHPKDLGCKMSEIKISAGIFGMSK